MNPNQPPREKPPLPDFNDPEWYSKLDKESREVVDTLLAHYRQAAERGIEWESLVPVVLIKGQIYYEAPIPAPGIEEEKNEVIEVLRAAGKPLSLAEIRAALPQIHKRTVRYAVRALVRKRQVVENANRLYDLPPS